MREREKKMRKRERETEKKRDIPLFHTVRKEIRSVTVFPPLLPLFPLLPLSPAAPEACRQCLRILLSGMFPFGGESKGRQFGPRVKGE